MAARAAQQRDFARLPEGDQARFVDVLHTIDRLQLSCRCEMVDGQDFTITIGSGYARAKFWMDRFNLLT